MVSPALPSIRRAGLLALALTLAPMLAPPAQAQNASAVPLGSGSLSGVWANAEYKFTGGFTARQRAIRTADGQVPPLLPAATAELEKRLTEADKGNVFANTLSQCLPGGMPQMLLGAAYPVQIIEAPGQITMLFEEQNHFRTIRLDGTHPKDPDPSYMGDSIGHWEGDTLVVDTIGLNDHTTLDMVGTPHSEALHLTERYRRVSASLMEARFTIDDPQTFSHPWEAKITYRPAEPGTHINEYICENNRNTTDAHGFQSFGGQGGK